MIRLKVICALTILTFGSASGMAQEIPLPELKKAVMSEFQTFPMQLDADTRLDKVEVGYNEILYYNTLVNYDYAQLNFSKFEVLMKQNLTTTYCTNPAVEGLRNANVSWVHLYYGKNGELFGTVKTGPNNCAEK